MQSITTNNQPQLIGDVIRTLIADGAILTNRRKKNG